MAWAHGGIDVCYLSLDIAGECYHICGYNAFGSDTFQSHSDYQDFVPIIEHLCKKHQWCCYAFCLLPSAYFLVIQTQYNNLYRGIKQLEWASRYIFDRNSDQNDARTTGQTRLVLLEKRRHLLEVMREVYTYPVRYNLVR